MEKKTETTSKEKKRSMVEKKIEIDRKSNGILYCLSSLTIYA